MPGFLDTNVAIRYLTDDPLPMALEAAKLIEGDETLYVTDATLTESAYVLRSVYKMTRAQIVDALVDLISRQNIQPWDGTQASRTAALRMCRDSGRVSIDDALLWATARDTHSPVVYTFDRQFPADGVAARRPGA